MFGHVVDIVDSWARLGLVISADNDRLNIVHCTDSLLRSFVSAMYLRQSGSYC